MRVTLSPKVNIIFMTLFSILFLSLIHFYGSHVLHYISEIKISLSLRIILFVAVSILCFAFLAYAKIYDPIRPQWGKKETKYWTPLNIDFSFSGVAKLLLLIFKIFLFSLLLYIVLMCIISSYNQIFNGIHEIDRNMSLASRFPEFFIAVPLFFLFLLTTHLVIKFLEKLGLIKKNRTNENEDS